MPHSTPSIKRSVEAIDHHALELGRVNAILLVRALDRRPIVFRYAETNLAYHPVCRTERFVLGKAVVSAVEPYLRNTRVALNACSLLKTLRNVVGDFAEDGDLALENLLIPAGRHVARDGGDETFAGAVVEDLLPQSPGGDEILGSDLGEESDGIAYEIAVCLVEIDRSLAELDGADRREIAGPGTLVVKCHLPITLEVAHSVWASRSIDGELLVVDADTVTVGVGV